MAPKGKIRTLPPKLRAEFDRRLYEGGFADYRGLVKWLGERGCQISTAAVQRYGQRMERRIEALKLATEQAREVVAAAGGADDTVNEGLMRLVQGDLFKVLFELKDVDRAKVDLNQLAQQVASICRSSVHMRRLAEEMRNGIGRRVKAAERKVVAAARGGARGGLSAEAERRIRAALLEIAELPVVARDELPPELRLLAMGEEPGEERAEAAPSEDAAASDGAPEDDGGAPAE